MTAKSVTNAQSPGSRSDGVGVSRRAAWCLAVIAVVALVVVLTARWLYRAKALADGGNEIGGPVRVGVTVFAPLMAVPAGNRSVNLDLQSVRPRVVVNTAHADIAVLTCVVSGATPDLLGDSTPSCSSKKYFKPGPQTVGYGPRATTIVLAITPRRAGGAVRINGVNVVYRDGFRHGKQHTGFDIAIEAVSP